MYFLIWNEHFLLFQHQYTLTNPKSYAARVSHFVSVSPYSKHMWKNKRQIIKPTKTKHFFTCGLYRWDAHNIESIRRQLVGHSGGAEWSEWWRSYLLICSSRVSSVIVPHTHRSAVCFVVVDVGIAFCVVWLLCVVVIVLRAIVVHQPRKTRYTQHTHSDISYNTLTTYFYLTYRNIFFVNSHMCIYSHIMSHIKFEYLSCGSNVHKNDFMNFYQPNDTARFTYSNTNKPNAYWYGNPKENWYNAKDDSCCETRQMFITSEDNLEQELSNAQ